VQILAACPQSKNLFILMLAFVAKACFETGIKLWACNANHTCVCVGSLFSQDLHELYPAISGDTDLYPYLWPQHFSKGKLHCEPVQILAACPQSKNLFILMLAFVCLMYSLAMLCCFRCFTV